MKILIFGQCGYPIISYLRTALPLQLVPVLLVTKSVPVDNLGTVHSHSFICLSPSLLQGFRELYALIEKHPSFDFHAFVASNTLPPYQNYVKRGLKAVEYERQCIAENKS